ncbi:MAG: HI0074 family nucleotidyltransferase substrate-binding subunit [Thermodesulfobacteriota bacterium]
MPLDLSSLRSAVAALEATLERCEDAALLARLDAVTRNALRAGAIQHFEFTFELCWKFLQRWLRENATPEDADHPRTRKELFRLAARHRLIDDPAPWFAYADARNLTSHTYNQVQAAAVYECARRFSSDARLLLQRLEGAND